MASAFETMVADFVKASEAYQTSLQANNAAEAAHGEIDLQPHLQKYHEYQTKRDILKDYLGVTNVVIEGENIQLIRTGSDSLVMPLSEFTPEGLQKFTEHPALKDSPIWEKLSGAAVAAEAGKTLETLNSELEDVFRKRHPALKRARELMDTVPEAVLNLVTDEERFNRGSLDSASFEVLHEKIGILQKAGADKDRNVKKLIDELRVLAETKDQEIRLTERIKPLLPEGISARTHVDRIFNKIDNELLISRLEETTNISREQLNQALDDMGAGTQATVRAGEGAGRAGGESAARSGSEAAADAAKSSEGLLARFNKLGTGAKIAIVGGTVAVGSAIGYWAFRAKNDNVQKKQQVAGAER